MGISQYGISMTNGELGGGEAIVVKVQRVVDVLELLN
jgi:hypothetical protein